MFKRIKKWLKSKAGKATVAGFLIVLLLLAIAGIPLGWWEGMGWGITGTAGLPSPYYPAPVNGYTCMPSCTENDGKFLVLPGEDMATFGGESVVLWISVPGDQDQFEVGIFDGDSGKDGAGSINLAGGHWDNTTVETTYTLYADPLKNGRGETVVGRWYGNQDPMPDNDWFNIQLDHLTEAKGPSGHYYYRFEATRPVEGYGGNAFKLRSTGYLTTGKSEVSNANFGLTGMLATMNDVYILYPEFGGNVNNPGPSTYSGEWEFYFYIPNDVEILSIWDGDFDFGTSETISPDTKDFNTFGKPDWAGPFAVEERAAGRGIPPDDYPHPLWRREPPVWYQFLDPDGTPVYINDDPSGTEEWEHFVVSTNPNVEADHYTDRIQPGYYNFNIQGLDLHNFVWVRVDYEIVTADCDGPCDPPPVWPEGSCPRTIGYWKNNVKKVLIDNKTNGVQESRETLEWGLNNVALASPLFRSGINVAGPFEIGDPVPLTAEEANMILQRDKKDYPAEANSMLARALQQNLATWLNLGTGKVGPTTVVRLEVPSGVFEGTIMEALLEAQDIILNGGDLERAKDIADLINNGELNTDPKDDLACTVYEEKGIIPKDKQPPKHKDMPKAPKRPEPPNPTPAPEPDPETCTARVNHYGVENPTNNPFYGIKFEFQSGEEVRDGAMDNFRVTLPFDAVQAMASVQIEAKAGEEQGFGVLQGCDFTSPDACGMEWDDTGFFIFYFMGAKDNGDGTLTLTFRVQNMYNRALSHVTIGLPEGFTPDWPHGSFEAEVCEW